MATARVPRLRSAIPSTDSFAMKNPTHCLLLHLPLRSTLLSTRYRTGTFHVTPQQLPTRNFSTTTRRLADPTNKSLEQQEIEASTQKSEDTLQGGQETTSGEQQSATPPPASSSTPSPDPTNNNNNNPNSTTTQPTPIPSPRRRRPSKRATQSDDEFLKTSRRITGTVIRTDTMAKTVAVATNRQYFDRFLQKHYTRASKTLVHDPGETLVQGDVIQYGLFPPSVRAERIERGKGRNVRHVLRSVVTPFGVPLEARARAGASGKGGGGVKRGKDREALES